MATAVAHSPLNKPKKPAVIVPLPLPGLTSKRVLIMEFIDGKYGVFSTSSYITVSIIHESKDYKY